MIDVFRNIVLQSGGYCFELDDYNNLFLLETAKQISYSIIENRERMIE